MHDLEMNKIAGAILAAGVIAMMVGLVSNLIYQKPHGTMELAYSIAPSESDESEPAAAEAPSLEPIAPLLASADLDSGLKVAKKCTTCHTFDDGGANKIGPNLYDIVNRTIAAGDGFGYSGALQEKASEAWTYENLNGFIAKPKEWAPGTKMSFAGIRKAQDRADLILYMRSLSGSPAALPKD